MDESGIIEGFGANGLVVGNAGKRSIQRNSLVLVPGPHSWSVSLQLEKHLLHWLYSKENQSNSNGFLKISLRMRSGPLHGFIKRSQIRSATSFNLEFHLTHVPEDLELSGIS